MTAIDPAKLIETFLANVGKFNKQPIFHSTAVNVWGKTWPKMMASWPMAMLHVFLTFAKSQIATSGDPEVTISQINSTAGEVATRIEEYMADKIKQ